MATVRCLKDGKVAVTNAPHLPPVSFKEGDELKDIQQTFANRLVELGFSEFIEEVPEKKPSKRNILSKKASKKRA
jgi:hypothetical protein